MAYRAGGGQAVRLSEIKFWGAVWNPALLRGVMTETGKVAFSGVGGLSSDRLLVGLESMLQ